MQNLLLEGWVFHAGCQLCQLLRRKLPTPAGNESAYDTLDGWVSPLILRVNVS